MFSIIFVFQSKFIAAFGIIIVACHRHQYVNCKENSELFHGIETEVLLVDFGIFLRPFSFVLLDEVYMYVPLLPYVLLLIRFFLIRIFFISSIEMHVQTFPKDQGAYTWVLLR